MTFNNNLSSKIIGILKDDPDKVALEYENSKVSYFELIQISFFFINDLEKKGIKKNNTIVVFHDKSKWAYALLIACNIKGIKYTNLDPSICKKRKRNIELLLKPVIEYNFYSTKLINLYKKLELKRTIFNFDLRFLIKMLKNISQDVLISDLCYIMFTSGSTGIPKGVPIKFGSVINFINWSKERFKISKSSKLSGLNPMYFDNSIFDFYCSIYNGCTLVPIAQESIRNTKKVIELLHKLSVTHWFSVPTFIIYCLKMKSLRSDRLSSIIYFIFGGEGFHKTKLLEFYNIYYKTAKFINVYGPTEATCICSSYEVDSDTFLDLNDLCPIGYISPYHDFKISKNKRKGELILIGDQISPGYINDINKKNKKFKIIKLNSGEIISHYYTGDIVEVNTDGLLNFKGRTDLQIKHMGYRIELEEIEFHIASNTNVSQTCVIYHQKDNLSFGEIIAFVSLNNDETKNFNHSIMHENLPNYMKPKRYIFLDTLPVNKNGKIDRVELKRRLNNE